MSSFTAFEKPFIILKTNKLPSNIQQFNYELLTSKLQKKIKDQH